ncbi:MAG TPA: hypothetical protein VMF69_03100 [Gemmataceae bacterium]|nr:hypothetical protein [Gemmataceae bacterium]
MIKLKIGLALGLLLGIAAGAVAMLTPLAPKPQAPQAERPDEPPKVEDKSAVPADRYGDPLPPGAVARLGTLRFHVPAQIKTLAFATDGKTLAISSQAGLYLIDVASGQRIKRLPTLGRSWSPEDKLAFSPDGKRLLSVGPKVGNQGKGVVHLWDLSDERKPRDYAIEPWLVWVGWSSEGQPLAIRVDESGALHLHELSSDRSHRFACAKPYKHPSGVISRNPFLACSAGAHALAVVDAEKTIHVWDTSTGRERCSFRPKGGDIFSLSFSPDGSRLAIRISKAVQMWDAVAGKETYSRDTTGNYGPPLFSSDGKTLAIADSARTIRVWDAETGKERGRIQDQDGFTTPIAIFTLSGDGKWLAAATYPGHSFHVWDVAAGKKRAEPVGHRYRPHGIVSLPDGRRVASGGGLDGVIQFWDRVSGEPLMRIHRPGQWLRDIALS